MDSKRPPEDSSSIVSIASRPRVLDVGWPTTRLTVQVLGPEGREMRAKPLGAGRAQPLGLSTLALRGPQLQAGGASAKQRDKGGSCSAPLFAKREAERHDPDHKAEVEFSHEGMKANEDRLGKVPKKTLVH